MSGPAVTIAKLEKRIVELEETVVMLADICLEDSLVAEDIMAEGEGEVVETARRNVAAREAGKDGTI